MLSHISAKRKSIQATALKNAVALDNDGKQSLPMYDLENSRACARKWPAAAMPLFFPPFEPPPSIVLPIASVLAPHFPRLRRAKFPNRTSSIVHRPSYIVHRTSNVPAIEPFEGDNAQLATHDPVHLCEGINGASRATRALRRGIVASFFR